ncbi:DNA topoisomerase 2, partial [Tanacetum coccineum]
MPIEKQDSIWIHLVQRIEETLWIWEDDQMIEKTITFVPLVYKLFDGILISAADRKGVKDILVNIDVAGDNISVWIHGEGVHDIDFTELPSAWVIINKGDGNGVSEEVVKSMGKKLKKVRISENWCMVSFKPDLAQFGMECLEHDIVALMKRRVVDLAGCCSGVKVQLDGTWVLPRTFEDYVDLYLPTFTHTTRIYEKLNDKWEICVAIADGDFEHFDQVSFVNNIPMKGGSYLDYITSQITDYLATILNVEPNVIESYLWVFVNAHIDNPAFDSQTKEMLTVESTCELTPEFLEKIADSLEDLDSLYKDLFKKSNARKLNIQDAKGSKVPQVSPQELEKNTDIQNIKKILGLQDGKIYKNVKELRYGHLMIMADEDHDGSRIKGLLINLLHYFWPSLLKVKNFMQWFIQPIVKASHKRTNKVFLFYTMSEYETMKKQLGNQFTITFYKGRETIESEKREYFFDEHIKDFVWENDEDGDAIELAFSTMKIEERKHSLQAPLDGTDLDLKEKGIRYRDFMNKEFKQYAMADLQRSIPSMVDGLKPRERKILFYALKKPIIQEIEVTQFSRYVLDHSPYHDGEVTLVGTIIGMAQNYVGSKSITPSSAILQLGSRRRCDVLPITSAKNHHPPSRQNYSSVVTSLAEPTRTGKSMLAMLPCYRGFKGEIKNTASNEYTTYGIITKDKDALTITELPVRCWTEDYKEFLEASRCGEDIKDYKACNDDDTSVHFEITMTKDQMNKAEEGGLSNKLKLTTTLSTANMYVLDAEGKLKKYDTPETLLEDFYGLRLDLYEQRKTSVLHELKIASLQLKSKERFAREGGSIFLSLYNKMKCEKCVELKKRGFKSLLSIEKEARKETQGVGEEDVAAEGYAGYDYLLIDVNLLSIDTKYIQELEEERKAKDKKIEHLTNSTPRSLWLKDLAALDEQLARENYPEAKYTKAEMKELAKYEKKKTSMLYELKIASLQLKSKERFAREVLNGELSLSQNLKHEKCAELKEKCFKSLPSIDRETKEITQKDEVVAEGYDYLLSLPTASFGSKYIEELEEERKAVDTEIEHLTTSTPMSLWLKDLAALLDEQLAREKCPEAEKKARAKRAGGAAGQSANTKRRM